MLLGHVVEETRNTSVKRGPVSFHLKSGAEVEEKAKSFLACARVVPLAVLCMELMETEEEEEGEKLELYFSNKRLQQQQQ